MTKEKIKRFKEILEKEKIELEEKLGGLGRKVGDNGDWIAVPDQQDSNEPDYLDQANYVEHFEDKIGALSTLEEQYNNVTRALGKIEKGGYGVCEISGDKIEEDRLEANPSARTCKAHMNERPENE